MRRLSILLSMLLCWSLLAQQQVELPSPDFKTQVTEIVVPVTVTDRDGNTVNNLQPRQFRLFDNNKEQDLKVQTIFNPVSLVVVIQANSSVESVLPQIRKIGSLLETYVVGEQGEAALMAFDHRFQLLQDFTTDVPKISEALLKVKPGSSSSRVIDAVQQSTRMLRGRPSNRRRVILLISETRDVASESRLREALIELQLANVSVYTVNMSRLITTLTGKAQPPRPDPLPPAARSMPSNVPATPTTVAQKSGNQGGSADFVPLMIEIYRDVKAIFKDNAAEVFTKGTGGVEYSFMKQRALEEAVARIGEEIHSQYVLTYTPNNQGEGGFHEIKVNIPDRSDLKVRTRPGYWMAARFN